MRLPDIEEVIRISKYLKLANFIIACTIYHKAIYSRTMYLLF